LPVIEDDEGQLSLKRDANGLDEPATVTSSSQQDDSNKRLSTPPVLPAIPSKAKKPRHEGQADDEENKSADNDVVMEDSSDEIIRSSRTIAPAAERYNGKLRFLMKDEEEEILAEFSTGEVKDPFTFFANLRKKREVTNEFAYVVPVKNQSIYNPYNLEIVSYLEIEKGQDYYTLSTEVKKKERE
jgi:hypothetical protein